MPRSARLDAPGVLQHVMGRGIERRKIFLDNRDREDFVRRLEELAKEGQNVYITSAVSFRPRYGAENPSGFDVVLDLQLGLHFPPYL